jgi:thiol-disulfide isomerase/thioredoxin
VLLRLLLLATVVATLHVGWVLWRRPPGRLRKLDLPGLGVWGPAVVQFTTPTCGPCKAAAPRLAKAADRAGVRFTEVDVSERPEVARRYGIRTVPTIVVAGQEGEVVGTWTALPGDGALEEAVRRAAT